VSAFSLMSHRFLDLYVWLLLASLQPSCRGVIAFNVVNTLNHSVAAVAEFLYRITERLLAPIRSFMPIRGGLDMFADHPDLIILFQPTVITYYILSQRWGF